ncbi:MAG: aspartate aminotransferase family protein [Ignavibacteria bacterium]|nr:aspartate aminotransferase family protein [Ignavibacteria bacterium]
MDPFTRESRYFFHTYKRIPLEIDRGEGMYVYSRDGKRYLDMFGGLAVNALGYGHPGVIQAIHEQSKKYIHLSNYYLQEPQLQLAELLVKHSGYNKVFLSNSGTESIEGALKLTRKWASSRGKSTMVSFSNAFHGRTMGALSMMDRPQYRNGYEPFLQDCRIVEFNNIIELRNAVDEKTAGILLEFIQGEGGIRLVSSDFVHEIKTLKEKHGFLLLADEIQAGFGRTGKFFGFQHFTINPDIVVVAKPLGGGLPLGAILGNTTVAEVLEPGVHGTTFGGNPVACAAGIVVLREIMERGLMKNAHVMGEILRSRLLDLQREFPSLVKEVRGFGLMIGMELTRECDSIVTALREHGILLNCTDKTVLRFLPPLIIEKNHIDEVIHCLRVIFSKMV